jgi:uncharacterized integral membrane protein
MIRLIIALVLSILLLIFVLQNLQKVSIHFLFWQFDGSMALILAITFIITLIISFLVSIPLMLMRGSKKKTESKPGDKTKEIPA